MIRLNFANLSDPIPKTGGQRGTSGTSSIYGALRCPTQPQNAGGVVGHAPAVAKQAERPAMSHLSHPRKNEVGRCKPSIYATVPLVPPVPQKKHMNEIDREAFKERAAIMEFDGGLSRVEAERLAVELLGRCA